MQKFEVSKIFRNKLRPVFIKDTLIDQSDNKDMHDITKYFYLK